MEIYPISNGVMLQHSVDITEEEATKIANEDISNRVQNFAKDLNMGITTDERIANTCDNKPYTIQCVVFSRVFANSATAADIELLTNDIKKFFDWFKKQKVVTTEEVDDDDMQNTCDWHREQEQEIKKFRKIMSAVLNDIIQTAMICGEGTITEDEVEFVKELGEDLTKTGEIPYIEAKFEFEQREQGVLIRCPGAWFIKAITAYLEKYGNTGKKKGSKQQLSTK